MSNLSITNEIGKLKKVMLHRPGIELEKLCPDDLTSVLFDDIPWMNKMKEEHDSFADVLRKNGAEVVYISNYLTETLKNQQAKTEIIKRVIDEEVFFDSYTREKLSEYLNSLEAYVLTEILIGGFSYDAMAFKESTLADYMTGDYGYYFKPLPNLYFTRDVSVVISDGLLLSVMKNPIRSRESTIISLLHKYHPDFIGSPLYYDKFKEPMSLEGGDILILSDSVVAAGFSQRSSIQGIDKLAQNLLFSDSGIKKVLAIKIPHERAFMHMDTVFTMVDYDKFVIFPNIIKYIEVTAITKGNNGQLRYSNEDNLLSALENALNIKGINLIKSGGNNPVVAAREQWNDSTNTLCVSPGNVITYNRNEISNEILEKNGINVTRIEGSELVRGRGGPRCMSMPLIREKI